MRHFVAGRLARMAALLPAVVLGAAPPPARAEPVRVATTTSGIYLSVFVAKEEGYFAARGLDVVLQPVTITSTMPAALVSGSVDIAGPSTPVFLQAVDGGIDLVALAGSGLAKPTGRNEALLTPPGSPIAAPRDLVGKRVAVPGIGTIMDVMFRNWLSVNQVDPGTVNFVEIGMAQMADALRGGGVDAAVANDPVLFRILREDTAKPRYVAYFMQALSGDLPIVVYVSTRAWVAAHGREAAAFQEANRAGAAFVTAHPAEARTIMAKYLHVAPNVVADMELPEVAPDVTADQLRRMADMMRQQNMLHGNLVPENLLVR